MKIKVMMLLMLMMLVGCSQTTKDEKKIDENTKVAAAKVEAKTKDEAILNLLKADGVTDFKVTTNTDESISLENDNCKIKVELNNGKTSKITSTMTSNVGDDVCVFRTLIKDKDLLGDDKDLYQKYMDNFREKDVFTIKGIKVTIANSGIEFIK